MEGFDLGRLNPISFERLVRALCFAKMGPGGIVYSSGPDGGRDFTYEGTIAGYESKRWNGYLVVQAKFKDPALDSTDDAKWLATQLDRELKKYTQSGTGLRKPEYYILVTNVRLSGSDGPSQKKAGRQRKGGYTKAADLFRPWKSTLKLKDFDIWPHDKIVDLLVGEPAIRASYAHFTTAGDVLTRALQQFKSVRPDFGEVTSRSIKNSLHRDQFVRLKDAGSVGDLQIRTSQVIVDLPLYTAEAQHQLRHARTGQFVFEEDEQDAPNAIARLVDRAREKLDPDTLLEDEDRSDRSEAPQARNRVVLMGGPGQGKSTISLFLTQLFRAAILKRQPNLRRDQGATKLVTEILKRAEGEQISTFFPARFPCHISLPRFADSVSAARRLAVRPPSLLSHIATEIGGAADDEIDRSDLRNWLRDYPWLLVLDGLDEVPPTGERPAVLDAINAFFTEVNEVNADILVVVTTRPQGYNKDLDPNAWEHWRLADLGPKQALRYAKVFGEARYPNDALRRKDVERSLVKAADQPATARLMTSPLQVTILHFIVDTGGGVPTGRWTLFNEYFEVLKKREKAKGGELQKILERHWGHLGQIHHRAGLVLQTDSEHAGGAGSRFTQERFRELILTYLESEGFREDDLRQRVEELMQLATDRLVLLSQQIEGTISFDVRSLQEFMAAAAITSEDQGVMDRRLSHIAGHSHWRHVFQIAASRCFAEDSFHYRRAIITQIARQMDTTGPDMFSRNGARLALDLLADGIALDHPNFRRPLIQHALEQLDLGVKALDDRLAIVCDDTASDIARDFASQKLSEGNPATVLCIWKFLFQASRQGHAWADDFIIQYWPLNGTINVEALDQASLPLGSQRVIDHLTRSLLQEGPTLGIRSYGLGYKLSRMRRESSPLDYTQMLKMNFADVYAEERADRKTCRMLSSFSVASIEVQFLSIQSDAFEAFVEPEFVGERWEPIRRLSDFVKAPSKITLAASVRALCQSNLWRTSKYFDNIVPWPIAAILSEAKSHDQLQRIALQVEEGSRGDTEQWFQAEQRWQKTGITEEDFYAATEDQWFGSDIGERGVPFLLDPRRFTRTTPMSLLKHLIDVSRKIKNREVSDMVVEIAAMLIAFGVVSEKTPEEVELILDTLLTARSVFPHAPVEAILPTDRQILMKPSLASRLGELLVRSDSYEFFSPGYRDLIIDLLEHNPQIDSLYYPAALAAASDELTAKEKLKRLFSKVAAPEGQDSIYPQLALATVQLIESDDLENAVDRVLKLSEDSTLFKVVLSGDLLPIERRLTAISTVIKRLREKGSPNWREYIPVGRKALDSRKSELTSSDVWIRQLKFPPESFGVLLPAIDNR
ncbi:NACHT domain-containing protein [Bradyrhizobium oligotrophicum]|uniref:NACHT domain-containing protein n=1 Tax=Bradyrhizobium oligotrophicum TaxID=44255 RepID=UPI003EBFFDD0